MNYFDGQAESISLSDEALFGDEAAAEERQEIARPQGEDAAEQSPEPNRTSGETAAENPAAPEQSGQAVEQAAEQTAEEPAGVNPELARLQSQYREAHATITRTAQALAEEKRARAEAEAKLQRLQSVPADPEQREVRLQKLLNDPSALIEEAAAPLIDQRLAEALRPFREQIQQQEETRLFGNALQDTMAIFPGLSNREQQTALIER
ncbi:MAG: hypothetical protein RR332_00180, partial [Clostridiales bacterium]